MSVTESNIPVRYDLVETARNRRSYQLRRARAALSVLPIAAATNLSGRLKALNSCAGGRRVLVGGGACPGLFLGLFFSFAVRV